MIDDMEHRDRLLTVEELADYLAVPVATLYQWRYLRKGPPGFRIGRHVRYRRSDIDEWIERQLVSSKPTTADHEDIERYKRQVG